MERSREINLDKVIALIGILRFTMQPKARHGILCEMAEIIENCKQREVYQMSDRTEV